MAKQNAINLDVTPEADGFKIAGGTTSREIKVSGGNVEIEGSGSAVITFPSTTSTLQTVDNKVTSFQATPDDTHYASEKLIKDSLDAKATKALDNLDSVAINTSLIPDTDNTDDLGSADKAWKDIYSRTLKLDGSTSGTVTVDVAAEAGTWSLTLPTSDGDNGQVLTTDGSGNTSWTTPSGGGSYKSGYLTRASNAGTDSALTIAHGLGKTPLLLRIHASRGIASGISYCNGIATSTSNVSVIQFNKADTTESVSGRNDAILQLTDASIGNNAYATLATLDSTNIVLNLSTFTDNGNVMYLQWEVFG